ncbi:MAG: DUF2344 domain-containing protein [Ruminococcaceae bacterium]|nr:DUF2344 domain-containing protein [Oscillospiraceae bacterium]
MLSEKKVIPGEKKHSLPLLDTPATVRIKFTKTGNLQFISHLDLQRTFHRVLVRANIPMWYTQGFNPHAKLVFGLPLSIGTQSVCEMADLRIDRKISLEDIKNQLNEQLTDEMQVLDAYYPTTKFNDIAFADYTVKIRSPKITPEYEIAATALFAAPIIMTKKSKSGEKEVDITDFIKKIEFCAIDGELTVNAVLSAGSTENLNPEYLVTALKTLDLGECPIYTIMRNRVFDKYLIEFK